MSENREAFVNIIYDEIASLAEWISNLIKIPQVLIRWVLIIIVLLLILMSLLFIEVNLKFLYFSSLQNKVDILKELNTLSSEDIKTRNDLSPIYNQLVAELKEGKVVPMSFDTLVYLVSPIVNFFTQPMFGLKFLSGAILGIVLITWALASRREKKWDAFRGAFIVAVFFGFVGVLMSLLFNNLVINSIIIIMMQIVLLIGIGRKRLLNKPTPVA